MRRRDTATWRACASMEFWTSSATALRGSDCERASQRMRSKGSAGRSTKVRADVFGTDGSLALHRRRRLASGGGALLGQDRSRWPSRSTGGEEVEPDEEAQMCARGELESFCLDDTQNLRDVPYRPRLVCRPHGARDSGCTA